MAQSKAKAKKPKGPAKTKRSSPSSKAKPAKAKAASAPKAASSNGTSAKSSGNGHGRATIPLIAGGAALAGTVGGVLLGASRSGHKVMGMHLPGTKRVKFKLKSSDLTSAAKEVGRFGENVGDLAAELKRTREGLAGDNKHSSPVEVLLRGLTTRR
jgi:hypothetical protein